MKKGIVAAVYLLIGILGIYRQFTMKTLTVEEAFSVLDHEIENSKKTINQKETKESYEYDMSGEQLPSEENETEGELYVEGYNVTVYFSDDDKQTILSILPAEAVVRLNKQIQLYLDQNGYKEASELFVVSEEALNRHQGFLFSAYEYPECVFEVYWDGTELQFGRRF